MNEDAHDAEMTRLLQSMADGNPGARDAVETLQRRRAQEFAELTADVEDVPWPAPAVVFDEDRLTDPVERDRRLAATSNRHHVDSKTRTMTLSDGTVWWGGERPRDPLGPLE